MLDENQEELFQTVKQMASNPDVDGYKELNIMSIYMREMNWEKHCINTIVMYMQYIFSFCARMV